MPHGGGTVAAAVLVVVCALGVLRGGELAAGSQTRGRTAPGEVNALAAGTLLVASRTLRDPNFAESVVLLVDYGKDGAAGLIVNVRTDVTLSRLFEGLDLGANGPRVAFAGGPVSRTSAIALVRSRPGATGVRTVAPGVDLVSTREQLERTLTKEAAERFRVYLGRAGWGSGQLDNETRSGAWHVFPADATLVFDTDPATMWRLLIRRAELLQVRRSRAGLPASTSWASWGAATT